MWFPRHPITYAKGWAYYRAILVREAISEFTLLHARANYPHDQLYYREMKAFVADVIENATGHRPRVSRRDLVTGGALNKNSNCTNSY